MIYTFSLEITVKNKMNHKTDTIDLFTGYDDVKESLIKMVGDEQIKKVLDLEKPIRQDYEDEGEYNEAIEEYENELEGAIEDYIVDIDFEDFDNFLEIAYEEGSFKVGLDNFGDVGDIASKIEEVSDDDDWRIVLAIYNSTYNDLSQAIDTYSGGDYQWYADMDMEEVVEQQIDEGIWGEIPSNIRHYLDIEAMARDLRHDGYHYDDEANGVICTY